MVRLDLQRQEKIEPVRMKECKRSLEKMGFEVTTNGSNLLMFMFNGELVRFWAYSGWHSGKSIKDGRGFSNLLKQLKGNK